MELTLSVLRCPDSVVPEQRRVPGGDYRLGRGADCDWVLADPDRVLSKQHCVLEFRSGGWEVRDTSANGTFVNHASAPVGRDQSAILNDGDRIRLGAYEIEIRVEQAAAGDWGGGAGRSMPLQAAPGWETPAPPRLDWNAQPAPREIGGAWEASGWEQAAQPTRQQDPVAPRIAGDPFAMPGLEQPSPFGNAPASGMPGSALPGTDPFATPSADPYGSEAMPDHRAATSDAFLPPRAMQQTSGIPDDWDLDLAPKAPVNQGPPPPAPAGPAKALPDEWDLDLAPPTPPPPRPMPAPRPVAAAAPPMAPVAPPMAPPPPPPPMAMPASAPAAIPAFPDDFDLSPGPPAAFPAAPEPGPAPRPAQPVAYAPPPAAFTPAPDAVPPTMTQFHTDDADPFREDVPVANGGPPPAAPVVVASVPMPTPAFAPPPAPAPAPSAYAPAPVAPAAGGGDASAGLAAFLAGAGLGSVPLRASPEETLQSLGAAFAAAIGGMRALLIARADVKREFRIEQTMLRAGANNPVKFSASDEQAIAGMIQLGPQKSVAALAETVADLTAHQVATLAATQAAARALLEKLAPAVVEGVDSTGSGLFGSREKKYWEAYKKLHQQVSDQFDDDFDSAFGKEFARAYEQASKK